MRDLEHGALPQQGMAFVDEFALPGWIEHVLIENQHDGIFRMALERAMRCFWPPEKPDGSVVNANFSAQARALAAPWSGSGFRVASATRSAPASQSSASRRTQQAEQGTPTFATRLQPARFRVPLTVRSRTAAQFVVAPPMCPMNGR